ncbi:hypothetical protein [Crenobacter caeni]|uniref:FimV N-terminal domain-containing protein n=1 Tax=Crenobacter caeni TaxID=2705474 RepID=A0A6B2KSI9_9NEIS|nr:hypothetical protein [Crenobacter caeni]NDV12939.1 hypothetical protein [Crenobacter caeni]
MNSKTSSMLLLSMGATLSPLAEAGLGQVKILSSQQDNFRAQVLVDTIDSVFPPLVGLANPADYNGLGRNSPAANGLKFKVSPQADGRWLISIEGPPLAADEQLRFALELAWAGGRWIREYAVNGYQQPRATGKPPAAATTMDAPTATGQAPAANAPRPTPARGLGALLSVTPGQQPLRLEFSLAPALAELAGKGQAYFTARGNTPALRKALEHSTIEIVRGAEPKVVLRTYTPRDYPLEEAEVTLAAHLKDRTLRKHYALASHSAAPSDLLRLKHTPPARQAAAPERRWSDQARPQKAAKHVVQTGDTLSHLARHYFPAEPALAEQILFQQNPHAFSKNNRNLLLTGKPLMIPPTLAKVGLAQQKAPPARAIKVAQAKDQPFAPAPAADARPQSDAGQAIAAVETTAPLQAAAPATVPAPAIGQTSALTASGDSAATNPAASEAPQASVPAAALQTQDAQVRRQQLLQEAKQRLAALEAEVARVQARAQAAERTSLPTTTDEAVLDNAIIRYITTGMGGLAVLSLLAWQLARRRAARQREELEQMLHQAQAPRLEGAPAMLAPS